MKYIIETLSSHDTPYQIQGLLFDKRSESDY